MGDTYREALLEAIDEEPFLRKFSPTNNYNLLYKHYTDTFFYK